MTKFLRVLSITFILCCMITGCNYDKKETTIVKATVTQKEYIESHTDYGYYFDGWKGKFRWKFKTFPAEYNVTVQYNELVTTRDAKDLFESVEVGDTIDMELNTYFDSEGEIIEQSMYFSN